MVRFTPKYQISMVSMEITRIAVLAKIAVLVEIANLVEITISREITRKFTPNQACRMELLDTPANSRKNSDLRSSHTGGGGS